jgi:hypothetical protein
MAISDKSRKLLWGRSGSHCAFCQQSLIVEKTDNDSESVVGDEAHIVSKRPSGPRGHIELKCDHDDYENFILLCRIHHKMVDDQPNTYTVEFLLLLKGMHEFWVDQQLTRVESKPSGPHLSRIERGKDLTIFFQGSLSFSHMRDPLDSPKAEDSVAILLESILDYMDLWDEFGIGHQMSVEKQFDQWIADVERHGYWIFAANDTDPKDERGNKLENWKSFTVAIKKNTSPDIIKQPIT